MKKNIITVPLTVFFASLSTVALFHGFDGAAFGFGFLAAASLAATFCALFEGLVR